ncbi:MAG: quinolinate synthase NadA [bacterium]
MNQTLIKEIHDFKKKQHALILCHNYQPPEIYEVADFIGDSLELARQAQGTDCELIVFCGVRFMAETAKLLNPKTRVVLAEPQAGCQMAKMITAEALRREKARIENVLVVAYVNTDAAVKAEADICCTSANAVQVVSSLPADRPILFVPDKNLARWVERETKRTVIPWEGFCYVHAFFTTADVNRARKEHPQATVIVHPECPPEVIEAADRVASTGGMLRLAQEYPEIVLGTEVGMCYRIRREYPNKICHPLRRTAICRNMKLTTLEKVRLALLDTQPEIIIPEEIAHRARLALQRMMEIS